MLIFLNGLYNPSTLNNPDFRSWLSEVCSFMSNAADLFPRKEGEQSYRDLLFIFTSAYPKKLDLFRLLRDFCVEKFPEEFKFSRSVSINV